VRKNPNIDFFFLFDAALDMGGNGIFYARSDANSLIDAIRSDYGDRTQFGVGYFNTTHWFHVLTKITGDTSTARSAINLITTWTGSYLFDNTEPVYYALDRVAKNSNGEIGWRSDSKKITIVLLDLPTSLPLEGPSKSQTSLEINTNNVNLGFLVYPWSNITQYQEYARSYWNTYISTLNVRGVSKIASPSSSVSDIKSLVNSIISLIKKIDATITPDKYSSWVSQTPQENVNVPDGGLNLNYPVTIKPQESGSHTFTLTLQGDGEVFKTYEVRLTNDCSAKPSGAGMLKETFSDSSRGTKEATFEKGQKAYVQISAYVQGAKSGINIYDYVTQVKPGSPTNFKLVQNGSQLDVVHTETIVADGSGTITFGPLDLIAGESKLWYEYTVAD